MPVVLGLASSHAPSLFASVEQWPAIHKGLTRDVPQPKEFADETPEMIAGWIDRIQAAFATLRETIAAHSLDAMIIVGDDQAEVLTNACNPGIAVYAGETVSGSTSISWLGQDRKDNHSIVRSCPQFLSLSARIIRRCRRVSVATRLARRSPIFSVMVPSGSGIYGSGGLSHDPIGPRAGWVDEPLDRWVIERIERGEGRKLGNLFSFDSDTLRGGTGEIRSWIVAAGAFDGVKGTMVDYIPARHAVTGLGFAYWTRA